eukprot:5052949-Pyramimonas_sp.AAC.1
MVGNIPVVQHFHLPICASRRMRLRGDPPRQRNEEPVQHRGGGIGDREAGRVFDRDLGEGGEEKRSTVCPA